MFVQAIVLAQTFNLGNKQYRGANKQTLKLVLGSYLIPNYLPAINTL